MKKMFFSSVLAFFIVNCYAQTIVGNWYGILKVPGHSVRIVFHISKTGDAYNSTMDSPDQGAKGLPVDKTDFINNELTLNLGKFGIKYIGTFKADSNIIAGLFIQGNATIPLRMSVTEQTDVVKQPPRPQDPTDFPYKQEEVTFNNIKGGDQLAGTLTIPSSGKISKIVILITGSGPQNRNEELGPLNHRPFLVWSDWLTRNGIAVLRYDDRGVGKSTGDFQTATTADFADDTEAAIDYIKSRKDLNGLAIGLIGHSEGGIIAPLVASRNKSVKFVVTLAGPGVPISELMMRQAADQLRLNGASDQAIKLTTGTNGKLYAAVIQYNSLPDAAFKLKLDSVLYADLKNYPEDALRGNKPEDLVNHIVEPLTGPWYRYFLNIDPATYLAKVKCPVLAINGTLDMQVNCESNLEGIKKGLQMAGNKNHLEVALPGLNHLLQQAHTGGESEYGTITETVDPIALQKVAAWINQLH